MQNSGPFSHVTAYLQAQRQEERGPGRPLHEMHLTEELELNLQSAHHYCA